MSVSMPDNDAKLKAVAMERYTQVFSSRNMARSVEHIKDLAHMILKGADRPALTTKFHEFLEDAYKEFVGNSVHRDNCIKLVDRLVTNAVKTDPIKFHNTITDSIESMQERTNARLMLGKLVSIFRRNVNMTEEERLIGMSMLYLAMVEGPFEEDVRACYVWSKLAVKEDISYLQVSRMDIKDIREYFQSSVGDTSLFQGYNRNLRNAIAHFSYTYDKNTRKMAYTDKRTHWTGSYTLQEFGELYETLDNVDEMIMILLLILALRDLCFATNPPWREKEYL